MGNFLNAYRLCALRLKLRRLAAASLAWRPLSGRSKAQVACAVGFVARCLGFPVALLFAAPSTALSLPWPAGLFFANSDHAHTPITMSSLQSTLPGQDEASAKTARHRTRAGLQNERGPELQLGIEGHWLQPDLVERSGSGDATGVRPFSSPLSPEAIPWHSAKQNCPGRLRTLFSSARIVAVAIQWRIADRCVSDWFSTVDSPPQSIMHFSQILRAEGYSGAARVEPGRAFGVSSFHRQDRRYTAQVWMHCTKSGCRVFASETTLL